MNLGVGAGSAGQERLPCSIVEARVEGPVCVEYLTLFIIIKLDPKAIELDVLEKI